MDISNAARSLLVKLYFIPFACSLAARIAIEEAELDAEFIQTKPGAILADGRPFSVISPMGYVPAIESRDGMTLTEGPAVLSYIADLAAEGVLAPPPYTPERYRMTGWLNFVSTELHKAVFHPLLARYSPGETNAARDGAREYARALAPGAFRYLSDHLEGREFLLDQFSVADAYLLAVLNWCETAGLAIADWPALMQWRTKMRMRPSVQRAMAAELPLLKAA